MDEHGVIAGFREAPSKELLERIESVVRAELSGRWDVSIEPDGESPTVHLHKIDNHTTEFHRAHSPNEPAVIWKRIPLPTWQNRPVPRPIVRDHHVMLLLAAICGLNTLGGSLFERVQFSATAIALCFVVAYLSGGWFATQDVWHALKSRKIDIQFYFRRSNSSRITGFFSAVFAKLSSFLAGGARSIESSALPLPAPGAKLD